MRHVYVADEGLKYQFTLIHRNICCTYQIFDR